MADVGAEGRNESDPPGETEHFPKKICFLVYDVFVDLPTQGICVMCNFLYPF
jgi:hypothetical protein